MRIIYLLAFLLCFNFTYSSAQDSMSNIEMEEILSQNSIEKNGEPGNWQCIFNSHPIFVLTDESANRMRIFAPILEEKELKIGQMKAMLEANFHSALDAKYSLYEGFVISVFTHPLEELTKQQFIDAMEQVVNLSHTFGSSYTSGVGINIGDSKKKEGKKIKKS